MARWRDDDGDLWVSWSERFGSGFHEHTENVSEEHRRLPPDTHITLDDLCELWERFDYDPEKDTIGSD